MAYTKLDSETNEKEVIEMKKGKFPTCEKCKEVEEKDIFFCWVDGKVCYKKVGNKMSK